MKKVKTTNLAAAPVVVVRSGWGWPSFTSSLVTCAASSTPTITTRSSWPTSTGLITNLQAAALNHVATDTWALTSCSAPYHRWELITNPNPAVHLEFDILICLELLSITWFLSCHWCCTISCNLVSTYFLCFVMCYHQVVWIKGHGRKKIIVLKNDMKGKSELITWNHWHMLSQIISPRGLICGCSLGILEVISLDGVFSVNGSYST